MRLAIEKSALFQNDVTNQFRWYFDVAGEEVAWEFFNSIDATLFKLAGQPDLGRKRRFQNPALQDLRSFRVDPPFRRLLIFYHVTNETLSAWRLMHGSRDLVSKLTEPIV